MKNKHIESIKRKLASNIPPNDGVEQIDGFDDEDEDYQEILDGEVSFADALDLLVENNGFDGKVPSGTYIEFLEEKGYSITSEDIKRLSSLGDYMNEYTLLMNVAYDIFYAGKGHNLPVDDSIWEELAVAYADCEILNIRENVQDTTNMESIKGEVEEVSFASNIASSSKELVKSLILDYFGGDEDDDDDNDEDDE